MSRNRRLPFAHEVVKVHTYWDTNVSDFYETLLVLDVETEREIEIEYICQNNIYVWSAFKSARWKNWCTTSN